MKEKAKKEINRQFVELRGLVVGQRYGNLRRRRKR